MELAGSSWIQTAASPRLALSLFLSLKLKCARTPPSDPREQRSCGTISAEQKKLQTSAVGKPETSTNKVIMVSHSLDRCFSNSEGGGVSLFYYFRGGKENNDLH